LLKTPGGRSTDGSSPPLYYLYGTLYAALRLSVALLGDLGESLVCLKLIKYEASKSVNAEKPLGHRDLSSQFR